MIEAAVGAAGILAAGAVLVARRLVRERGRRHDTRALTDRALLNAVQTGVLPVAPPRIDGVRLDASYRMAGAVGGPIGGDFYVFVPFEDGTVGIGVGDVAGHGPAAVAAMANARLTLRAIASVTPDPSVALSRTEFVLRRTGTLDFLSVLYGVLDPLNGTWTQVNAGHCPPILKRFDGSTTLLTGESGTVLGASPEATTFESSQMGIEPGDVLVLYTDGLVERRDASIDVGIERVCEIIRQHTDTSTLTGALMSSAGVEPADDVAVVVIEVGDVPQPAIDLPASPGRRFLRRPTHVHARQARDGELVQTPLGTWVATSRDWVMTTETGERHLIPYRTFRDLYVEDDDVRTLVRHDGTDQARARQRFAPDPESVPAARRFVRSWLRGAEVDVDEEAVALLTTELASNAVTHARSVFQVEVEVETSASSIRVGVHDQNRHNITVLAPGPNEPSGRGLSIVASLAKDWGCDISPSGKTVWFELELKPDMHDSVSGP